MIYKLQILFFLKQISTYWILIINNLKFQLPVTPFKEKLKKLDLNYNKFKFIKFKEPCKADTINVKLPYATFGYVDFI